MLSDDRIGPMGHELVNALTEKVADTIGGFPAQDSEKAAIAEQLALRMTALAEMLARGVS